MRLLISISNTRYKVVEAEQRGSQSDKTYNIIYDISNDKVYDFENNLIGVPPSDYMKKIRGAYRILGSFKA